LADETGATTMDVVPPNPFAASAVWDDGRAEISLYETIGTKYGIVRAYETRVVVVKEDLLRAEMVKSNAGPLVGRTLESFKLLIEHDIPSGTYVYHQSAVVHVERATLRPLALTMNSIESCGLASVSVRVYGNRLRHRGHSYWEGESDRDTTLAWPSGASFYDALPLWVRGLWLERADSTRVHLLPGQVSNHVRVPAIEPAEITVEPASPDTTLISVRHAAGEDRFWIGTSPERPLLRWEKADGSVLVLRKRIRLAYWEHTKPGDERLLE
jgi:hypothetical protein